jgi:hypothetical protein
MVGTRHENSGERDVTDRKPETAVGHQRLWEWFGLSRAAFLTLPRVLMHEMPDDWQDRMTTLLEQYDATFTNLPTIKSTVQATTLDGKLTSMPEVLKNYRHPRQDEIEALR